MRAAVEAAVIAHACEAAPRECCGLLIGREGSILDAVRARNLEDDPTRYLIDPADHIAARRASRARGLEVVGFYHSHPRSSADASPSDAAEASYAGALYLIVGLGGGPPDVRLFRLDDGRLRPIDYDLAP